VLNSVWYCLLLGWVMSVTVVGMSFGWVVLMYIGLLVLW